MRWNRWLRMSGALPALFLVCGCLQPPWGVPPQSASPTPPRPDAKAPVQAKDPNPNQTPSPSLTRDRPLPLRPVGHEEPAISIEEVRRILKKYGRGK